MRLLSRMAPGLDVQAITQEIRLRIDEELDYELEASNQRAMARIFRGHPFVYVPEVIGPLSRERVMVTEFVSGTGFEELKGAPAEQRNRIAEIVFRFYFSCMYRHHQFSGDPHPGNFMLLEDGRVAFLDFGLYKRIPAELAEYELRSRAWGSAARASADRAPARRRLPRRPRPLHARADPRAVPRRHLVVHARRRGRADAGDRDPGRDRHERSTLAPLRADAPREPSAGPPLRPPHETLTLAVMSQLRATGNWHRIAREWIFGDQPVDRAGRRRGRLLRRLEGLNLEEARRSRAAARQPGRDPDPLTRLAPAELDDAPRRLERRAPR